jgi:hypothetical protein
LPVGSPSPVKRPPMGAGGRRRRVIAAIVVGGCLLGAAAVFVAVAGMGPCPANYVPPLELVAGEWTAAGSVRVDTIARPAGPCHAYADQMPGVDPAQMQYSLWTWDERANATVQLFNGAAGMEEGPNGGRILISFYDNAPTRKFSAGDVIVVAGDGVPAGELRGAFMRLALNGGILVAGDLPG